MTEDEQVRRLLADARHDDPMPPDVAKRMDGVLADLRSDRPVRPVVSDLAAARRRRRVRMLLAAAAAAVVVGAGVRWIPDLRTSGEGSSADGGAAGSSAERQQSDGAALDVPGLTPADRAHAVVNLDPERFAQQVRRMRARQAVAADKVDGLLASQGKRGDRFAANSCAAPPGRGRILPVRYAGSRGVLVYRPVQGDTQVVDLYLCGHRGPTRSITLPVP